MAMVAPGMGCGPMGWIRPARRRGTSRGPVSEDNVGAFVDQNIRAPKRSRFSTRKIVTEAAPRPAFAVRLANGAGAVMATPDGRWAVVQATLGALVAA